MYASWEREVHRSVVKLQEGIVSLTALMTAIISSRTLPAFSPTCRESANLDLTLIRLLATEINFLWNHGQFVFITKQAIMKTESI